MATPAPIEETEFTLWDVNAAASATGLSPRFVRQLLSERRLPVVKVGHLVRVRPADVRAFIEASTLPASSWTR